MFVSVGRLVTNFLGSRAMTKATYQNIFSSAVLFFFAAVSISTTAAPLNERAATGSALPAITVSFVQSELSSAEGRAVVERRIRLAAKVVCGSVDHGVSRTLTPHAIARNEACYERAVNEAMAQLGSSGIASIE